MWAIWVILSLICGGAYSTSQYNFNVSEMEPINTYIGKVTPTDVESNCSYNMHGSNEFRLDGNGNLFTTAFLDREVKLMYSLQVLCGSDVTPFAHVTINVMDVNDASPVFSQYSYTFVIKEDTLPGTFVGQVSATDADAGRNSLITYTLQTNGEKDFDIDSRTGRIIVTIPPSEILYVLRITAEDAGLPSRSTFCQVYIILPHSFTFSVPESLPPNSKLGSVLAVLPDMRDVYSTINLSPQGVPFILYLNNSVLSIYNTVKLDRETVDIYRFRVMASTSGTERILSNVTLHVLDVNDNKPQFTRSSYSISVNANSPKSTILLQVQAIDPDSGSHLSYSITNQSNTLPFAINPVTGIFYLVHTLEHQNYSVDIQVSDGKFVDHAMIYITTIFDEEVVG